MFRPFQNTRKAEQVVEEILAAVHDGRLNAGERLPDENTMAQEFGVSRNCVREALRVLETMGVVEVRHGRGCFLVHGTAASGPPFWLKVLPTDPGDVLEVREAIEAKGARLAALAATPEDIAQLERLARETAAIAAQDHPSLEEFLHHDRAFHAAVARASHNAFLVRLAPGTWAAADLASAYRGPDRFKVSAGFHRAVTDAITRHDPEAAGEAMTRHVADLLGELRKKD